jgi:hypothetical protein
MAMRFEKLKASILIVLYDYMLTADHEGFWFSLPAIMEGLPADVSGAFVQRALDALIDEDAVEQGGSSPVEKDLFALTNDGIEQAEKAIEANGIDVETYSPAPDADLILSRASNPEIFAVLTNEVKSLKLQLGESNSLYDDDGKTGLLIKAEIDAADALIAPGEVRVFRLKALIVPALRYLVKKFADQSIGEAAKRLLTLLIDVGI